MNYLNLSPEEKINNYNRLSTAIYEPVQTPKSTVNTLDALVGTSFSDPLLGIKAKPITPPKDESKINTVPKSSLEEFTDAIDLSILDSTMKTPNELVDDVINPKTIPYSPTTGLSPEVGSLKNIMKKRIGHHESKMNYNALNKNTGKDGAKGSGAWGAYQYIWSQHAKNIKNVTGITDPERFRKSKEAQDKYFDYQFDNWLLPGLKKIREMFPDLNDLSDADIMQGIHFRGIQGFIDILRNNQLSKKLDKNNPTAMEVIESGRKYENI